MKSCQLLPPASLDSLLCAVFNTDPTQLTVAHVKIFINYFFCNGRLQTMLQLHIIQHSLAECSMQVLMPGLKEVTQKSLNTHISKIPIVQFHAVQLFLRRQPQTGECKKWSNIVGGKIAKVSFVIGNKIQILTQKGNTS